MHSINDRGVNTENLRIFSNCAPNKKMDCRQKMVVPKPQKMKNEEDEDEDLETLRLAALQSLRPKNPLQNTRRTNLGAQNVKSASGYPSCPVYGGQRQIKRGSYPSRPPRHNGNTFYRSQNNQNLIEIVPVEEDGELPEKVMVPLDTKIPKSELLDDRRGDSKFYRYKDNCSGSDEEDGRESNYASTDSIVTTGKTDRTESSGTTRDSHSSVQESSGEDRTSKKPEVEAEEEEEEAEEEEPEEEEEEEEEEKSANDDDDDVLLMADLEEEDSLERLMDEMEREMNVDRDEENKEKKKPSPSEIPKNRNRKSRVEAEKNGLSGLSSSSGSLMSSKNDRRSVSPRPINRTSQKRRSLSPKLRPKKKSPRRSPARRASPRLPKKSFRDVPRMRSPRKLSPASRFSPRPRSPRLSPRGRSPNDRSPTIRMRSPPLRKLSPRGRSPPLRKLSPRGRSPPPRKLSPRGRSPPPRKLSPRGRSPHTPRRSRSPRNYSRSRSPRPQRSPKRSNRSPPGIVRSRSPRLSPMRSTSRAKSPRPKSPKNSPLRRNSPRRSPKISSPDRRRLSPRIRSPIRLSPHRSPWSSPRNSPRLSPRRRKSPKEIFSRKSRRSLTPEDLAPGKIGSPARKNAPSPEILRAKGKSKEIPSSRDSSEISDPIFEARRRKFESTKIIDPIHDNKKIKLSKKEGRNRVGTSEEILPAVQSPKNRKAEKITADYEDQEEDLCLTDDYVYEVLDDVISDTSSLENSVAMCVEMVPVKVEKERSKKKKKRDKELYQVGKLKGGELPLSERIGKEKKCKKRKEPPPNPVDSSPERVIEDLAVDEEEADLRTELSRRRAERLNRAAPIQSARLLQSAFKGVVNEVAKTNAKVIQRHASKGEEKNNKQEVRRVTVLHRTVADLPDSEEEVDPKVPIRFRLGLNKASQQESREVKSSRKSSKRSGRKVKHKNNMSLADQERKN